MRLFFVFVGAHPVGDGLQGDAVEGVCHAIAHRVGSYKSSSLPVAQGFKGLDQ